MNIKQIRDDELVGLIAEKKEDPDAAADAWVELRTRHVDFIYHGVLGARNLVGHGIDIEDIVERTFQEVYLKAAETFRPGTYADSDDARRHVAGWLGAIAKNELVEAITSRGNKYVAVFDPETTPESESDMAEPAEPAGGQANHLAEVAKSVLSSDDLEIVWLKMQYYDADTGKSQIPSEQLDAICAQQGISKDVFRQRYKRALATIEQTFTEVKQGT
ncbi:MAG: sigma-70 family RNA polymerase sigma factor [Planctomycetota bacterium]|nr:MAG: sigma-70 family RNA polymerase sigma factor [Planctomycetota bacterium]REK28404.1 MAG: sigma-70 family RNA polymerase sigma factor [Planctomycetota bacterium]REK48420.1 MAG: sigma-70 family RNA polymerase sigma factor [Planctomycetota bacterium]